MYTCILCLKCNISYYIKKKLNVIQIYLYNINIYLGLCSSEFDNIYNLSIKYHNYLKNTYYSDNIKMYWIQIKFSSPASKAIASMEGVQLHIACAILIFLDASWVSGCKSNKLYHNISPPICNFHKQRCWGKNHKRDLIKQISVV